MPAVTRVSDISQGICSCCCASCPHAWISVHVAGSSSVNANGQGVMRTGDIGSSTCPHCPTSFSVSGSSNVQVDGRPVHRVGDVHVVGCGTGIVISGSPNINING